MTPPPPTPPPTFVTGWYKKRFKKRWPLAARHWRTMPRCSRLRKSVPLDDTVCRNWRHTLRRLCTTDFSVVPFSLIGQKQHLWSTLLWELVLEKKHTLHHKNSHQWICWYWWKNIRYITKTAINESAGTGEKTYVTSQKQPSMNLLVLVKKHTLHHKNSHQWICWYWWKNIRYITKTAINESAGTGEC